MRERIEPAADGGIEFSECGLFQTQRYKSDDEVDHSAIAKINAEGAAFGEAGLLTWFGGFHNCYGVYKRSPAT